MAKIMSMEGGEMRIAPLSEDLVGTPEATSAPMKGAVVVGGRTSRRLGRAKEVSAVSAKAFADLKGRVAEAEGSLKAVLVRLTDLEADQKREAPDPEPKDPKPSGEAAKPKLKPKSKAEPKDPKPSGE